MDLVVIDVNRFLRAEFALIVCECVVPQRKAVRLENRAWMRQLVEKRSFNIFTKTVQEVSAAPRARQRFSETPSWPSSTDFRRLHFIE